MYDIVVIGASQGGLRAIQALLGGLPPDFPLPVAVVLHRGKDSGEGPATNLQQHTPLRVEEPDDKQVIEPGRIYLAPANYHLLVEHGHFALSVDAPDEYARPSVNLLFESAADAYRERVIGVILTGTNQDGAQGLAAIGRRGGLAVVQDPATAEAAGMPRAALAAADHATVLPLEEIGPFLAERVGQASGDRRQ